MRAIAVLAVTAAAVVALSGAAAPADAQGFKASFTLNGLQQFEAAIVAFVNSKFQDLSLPDMHLEPDIPVIGKIDLDLTNIVITGFNIPGAAFSLSPPNGMGFGVEGTGLTVKLDWHWRRKDWPHASDHGSLEAVPKQGNINAGVVLSVDGTGRPHFACSSATADFDKIELHFSGHWDSWLYQFLADLFSSTIRHTVDSEVASALTNIINSDLNNAMAKLPTRVYFGGGHSRMDVDIAWAGIPVAATYLELVNDFAISDNSSGVACPYPAAPLPDLDPQSHQLQFFIAGNALNCAVWVPYANDAIHFRYPSTTAFWAEFIPQLNTLYPGDQFITDIFPLTGQPNITMTTAGVFGAMSFSMNQSAVLGSGQWEYTDTLSIDAAFGIDLWVGPSKKVNNTNDLFGQVTNLKLTVGVLDSVIGTIDLSNLQLIIDVALPVVTGVLNGVLGAGIPLPLIPYITLVNPQVVFGDGYFGIATDFNFGADALAADTDAAHAADADA